MTVSLAACRAADVMGKVAVTSFEALLNTASDKVTIEKLIIVDY